MKNLMVLGIFMVFTAHAYAWNGTSEQNLDARVKEAATIAAAKTRSAEARRSIERVVEGYYPANSLIRTGDTEAQEAILNEMNWQDILQLPLVREHHLRWLATEEEVNSNFSFTVSEHITDMRKLYLRLFERANSAWQWSGIVSRMNSSLRLIAKVSKKPITKWVPYQGERDRTGDTVAAVGYASGSAQLVGIGVVMNILGSGGPVNVTVPDPEMAEQIRKTAAEIAEELRMTAEIFAGQLGVSAVHRSAVLVQPVVSAANNAWAAYERVCESWLMKRPSLD